MKNSAALVVVVILAITSGGCATVAGLGRIGVAALPQVDSPAIQNLTGSDVELGGRGIGASGQVFVVRSPAGAPGHFELVAGGKVVAQIENGGLAWDARHYAVRQETIPVVAQYYDDSGTFRGVTAHKFQASDGSYKSVQEWTISPGEVRLEDGSTLADKGTRATSPPGPAKRMRLPSAWVSGRTEIQVALAWNGHELHCQDRQRQFVIRSGAVGQFHVDVFGQGGGEWVVFCSVTRGGVVVRNLDPFRAWGSEYSNQAYQLVVTPRGTIGW